MPWQKKVQREVKDRLFRFLFEKDKEALLQLYNALNGTDYNDASELQVVTIESAVYVVMKNDLAFVLAGTLNLYEHQSTCNPNMPVRFLIYLAEEYQKLIEQAALNAAVDYCVAHGILDSTLREHRAEVLWMLLEEFDADKYERTIRMEGVQQGIQQGEEQGMQRGISRANRLTQLLLEQNRTEDLKRALEDSGYQDMLFREYDL